MDTLTTVNFGSGCWFLNSDQVKELEKQLSQFGNPKQSAQPSELNFDTCFHRRLINEHLVLIPDDLMCAMTNPFITIDIHITGIGYWTIPHDEITNIMYQLDGRYGQMFIPNIITEDGYDYNPYGCTY